MVFLQKGFPFVWSQATVSLDSSVSGFLASQGSGNSKALRIIPFGRRECICISSKVPISTLHKRPGPSGSMEKSNPSQMKDISIESGRSYLASWYASSAPNSPWILNPSYQTWFFWFSCPWQTDASSWAYSEVQLLRAPQIAQESLPQMVTSGVGTFTSLVKNSPSAFDWLLIWLTGWEGLYG